LLRFRRGATLAVVRTQIKLSVLLAVAVVIPFLAFEAAGATVASAKNYKDLDRLFREQHGYRFLRERFLDQEHAGYYWKTDLAGKPVNERKLLYGEAFVIYAFVEYYRASGDREALRNALDLYRLLQKHAHDGVNSGWSEHFTRDWKLIAKPDAGAEVEVPGLKSANAHLHFMEALTELYQATGDAEARKSLEESLRLNATYFYPEDAARSCFHRQPDWKEVTESRSEDFPTGTTSSLPG